MTLPVEKKRLYTLTEYLDLEVEADERHEFHDGEILAMSGGSYRHAKIAMNASIAIGNRLKGKPCQPLGSDMRVRIPKRLNYVYPDISIICGPPEFDVDDPRKRTIINPKVIIEVLSDSTERYDRHGKFELYRRNPPIEEYVLISQARPSVEAFLRQPEGAWLLHPYSGMEAQAILRSVDLTIPLSEIFEGITFDEPR